VQSKIGEYRGCDESILMIWGVAQSMERSTRRVVCDLGVLFIISVLCFDFVTKKE
jgi:hypothetical protein